MGSANESISILLALWVFLPLFGGHPSDSTATYQKHLAHVATGFATELGSRRRYEARWRTFGDPENRQNPLRSETR